MRFGINLIKIKWDHKNMRADETKMIVCHSDTLTES